MGSNGFPWNCHSSSTVSNHFGSVLDAGQILHIFIVRASVKRDSAQVADEKHLHPKAITKVLHSPVYPTASLGRISNFILSLEVLCGSHVQ